MLAAACVTAMLSTSAEAQTAGNAAPQDANANPGGVEEVIVSAQRKAERLQDAPVSVTAVSTDSLANRGITALNAIELPQFVPGLVSTQISSRPANYRTVATNFYGSVPLSDALAMVHYENRGKGSGRNLTTGKYVQNGDSFGIRSKILWESSDRTTVRLSGIYSIQDHVGYPGRR